MESQFLDLIELGYHARPNDFGHYVAVLGRTRQVAMYKTNGDGGKFDGWGWVEKRNASGRVDVSTWAELLAALESLPSSTAALEEVR